MTPLTVPVNRTSPRSASTSCGGWLVGQERLRDLDKLLDLRGDVLDGLMAESTWRQVAAPPFGGDQQLRLMTGGAQPQQSLTDAPRFQSVEVDRDLLVGRLVGRVIHSPARS